jgi:alkylation response protein AidB-like acyl-CoA dehydrogenase
VVDMLWASRRPEQDFLRALRRFFRGCACVTDSYRPGHSRGRARRRRTFHCNILSSPGQLQAAAKQLVAKRVTGCDDQSIQSLVANLQTITLRLQAAELAQQQLESEDAKWRDHLGPPDKELRDLLQDAFLGLSRFEGLGEEGKLSETLARIFMNLERADEGAVSVAFHGLLGSIRGLLAAVDDTRETMRSFDWPELSKARF